MKKTLKHQWLLLIATTALLAACGGHNGYTDPGVKPPVCIAPQVLKDGVCVSEPMTMMDAFTKYVSDLLANLFEDKEPIVITDVVLTTPDNTEPEIIK